MGGGLRLASTKGVSVPFGCVGVRHGRTVMPRIPKLFLNLSYDHNEQIAKHMEHTSEDAESCRDLLWVLAYDFHRTVAQWTTMQVPSAPSVAPASAKMANIEGVQMGNEA